MRRRWSEERARLFSGAETGQESSRSDARLVGRDFAPVPTGGRRPFRPIVTLTIGTVLAALLLVSLRVDIVRLRYAVAEAASEEELLLERQREMTVRVRELRDPARLRALASERGFTRPMRVITLAESVGTGGGR
jgi:hypothetical protein